MRSWNGIFPTLIILAAVGICSTGSFADETVTGEALDPELCDPGFVESMAAVIARDRDMPREYEKGAQGRQGEWAVPSRRSTTAPHSGEHHVVNKWGDTRMGIGFPQVVDVAGAYFAGQAAQGVWTTGVQAIGYRDGQEVQRTEWFRDIGAEPKWFEMNLQGVDRIEIVSEPVVDGGGWYAMDDFAYTPRGDAANSPTRKVVLDFEDLGYRAKVTGSGYAGLSWEPGSGEFTVDEAVHAPVIPPGVTEDDEPDTRASVTTSGTRAMQPILEDSFQGVVRGDADSWSYPPDTDGAVGPNHYVITVNRNFAVYDKASHVRVVNSTLGSFLPGSNGDPRVLFDQHSQRWIVTVPDFNTRIYLAVSLTDDPTGSWYKTSFVVSAGDDSGCWPDYPTLGVDQNGIYCASYMVGCGMTIFALDKAPLIAASPSLGTVTAFRGLPWEGAIQPAHTYGTPSGEYFVSVKDSNELRVRRVNPPLTSPTLTNLGTPNVPSFSDPPTAPALGSSTNLDTVDRRLMMSVYRDGSLWTCHTIAYDGRAACRWYEIDAATTALIQSGTVASGSLYYFFPSIMVNQHGSAVLAFSGSSSNQYAGCYYTGRLIGDPPGEMAAPVQYKAGTGAQNNIDDYGRNRWGDYSYTTLDPEDEATFWTIQEYGHSSNVWGTYIAVLSLGDGDCNNNGIPDIDDILGGTSEDCNGNNTPDECDLESGLSQDCNTNAIPDECDVSGGTSSDCNYNGEPDECELATYDCNTNGVPDDCDIIAGTSLDCNYNMTPDECELADFDCNSNEVPDDCDISAGTSPDCNNNGIPDECDLASGSSLDCNSNGIPDDCDIAGGTSPDCNFNSIPDECDLAGGTSTDCNSNGIPDECDLLSTINSQSPQLTPLGNGFPQTYIMASPARGVRARHTRLRGLRRHQLLERVRGCLSQRRVDRRPLWG